MNGPMLLVNYAIVTHCGLVTPYYVIYSLVIIGSANGLLLVWHQIRTSYIPLLLKDKQFLPSSRQKENNQIVLYFVEGAVGIIN